LKQINNINAPKGAKGKKAMAKFTKEEAKKHWVDMPEFKQEKKEEFQKIIVRFDCLKDVEEFAEIIGQKLTSKTKSIWFPKLDRHKNKGVYYDNEI